MRAAAELSGDEQLLLEAVRFRAELMGGATVLDAYGPHDDVRLAFDAATPIAPPAIVRDRYAEYRAGSEHTAVDAKQPRTAPRSIIRDKYRAHRRS
jgi:hypothetical protein